MLKKDYDSKSICYRSITSDGDCCCNCIHRVLSTINGFPCGYYCNHPILEDRLVFIGFNGHSMCEMHQRKKDEDLYLNEMEIIRQ